MEKRRDQDTIEIRRAGGADIRELCALSLKLNMTFGDDTQPAEAFLEQNFEHLETYVALENDKVVGFASGVIVPLLHMGRKNFDLHSIYVEPDFRRSGVGGRLIEKLITDMKEQGIFKISIQVWKDNKSAIRFYENMAIFEQNQNYGNYLNYYVFL